ncbi:hypothetical protein PRIPAC_76768 [Pristionchus pacificus]|uniref:RNA binding protein n=1 Tax=Pristionchus pacificus TaxID=54126 RepID=A0A2A6BXR3_PRIPA|nr:hypothetical protein PRIPAC_76768 [Pristionchus pacificus]|eukprot:PDM70714.1 RNA binding protein [Pristionchus pacificus]
MGSNRKRKRQSNGESSGEPAKRRRSSNAAHSRPNSRNDSSKGAKKPPVKPVPPSSSAQSTSTEKEKRKHRSRCHKLCAEAVDKITKALRSSPSPIGHLFKLTDEDAVPYAFLSDIAPVLSLPPRLLTLPADKLTLLNGNEHVFQMAVSSTGQFIVKYAPVDFSIEDATVYLDRLPYPCSLRLLEKLCTKFGTAVDIRIPLRTPAPLLSARRPTVLRRKGTQHRGFAFVQFACREEAEAICKEFALNHPIVQQNKTRWFFNRGKRVHLGQHATKFAALTALRHGRMMRRLYRERRKKRRKREKLRKAGKLVEKKAPEVAKKSKSEKRKEANKKRRKRLSDMKKEAKRLLAEKTGEPMESDSESAMDTSGEEERKDSVNGLPPDPKPCKENGEKNEEGKEKKMEEEKPADEIAPRRRRRCKRKEIRKSIRSHFIDTQAIPFREYQRMREEYLRLRKEEEQKGREQLRDFTASNSNHKREEFREANWSLNVDEE